MRGSATSDTATSSRQRKRPKDAPTHVVEIPLSVTEADRRALQIRFKAAGSLKNRCVAECRRRMAATTSDPAWAAAKAMEPGREKTDAFRAIKLAYGFTRFSLERFAREKRDGYWIRDHLGGHDSQVVAANAFGAAERHLYRRGGRPRFRKIAEMRSIASKDDANFMRLKGRPEDGPSGYVFEFRGLGLRLRRTAFSPTERQALGLKHLSYKVIHHRDRRGSRFALQVVVDGPAPTHRPRNPGMVGIDLGPAKIAVVTATSASLRELCPDFGRDQAGIRRLSRKMDRSMRANNPECFREDGIYIKGRRIAKRSKAMLRMQQRSRRANRMASRHRRNAHGRMSNTILAMGTTIHAEALNYASWAALFGKAVGLKAPGLLMSELRRKAEAAGGGFVDIPAHRGRLSQFDHGSGDCLRKPLSLRVHAMRDGSGLVIQRDLYSAYLALHCDAEGVVDVAAVRRDWREGACGRLVEASREASSGSSIRERQRAKASSDRTDRAAEARTGHRRRRSASPRTDRSPTGRAMGTRMESVAGFGPWKSGGRGGTAGNPADLQESG